MQFIIEQTNLSKYFCEKGKVIVFDSEQDAYAFVNQFYQQFAIPQGMAMAFQDPGLIGDIIQSSQNWRVIEKPESFNGDIINFEDIKRGNR